MAQIEYIKNGIQVYCVKGKKPDAGKHTGTVSRVKMIGNKEQFFFIDNVGPTDSWEKLVAEAKTKIPA